MRVIHRAATFAYAFVAMNLDQVGALAYLVRGADSAARRDAEQDAGESQPETKRENP